ncbi:class II fructose-1,6-bisphosphate aldolase [Candidatus Bathyarchaeota archaeon]|nr:class II fructose-1,6-bisphosphate aldolase [Candidatus Bathyarchaeota archaeon]
MSRRLYIDLGLSNTREMLSRAYSGGYAVPGYNFNNMEQLQAIIQACAETRSPVILQVSKGARKYANRILLRHMAMGAVQMVKDFAESIPIALHLDHGDSFELCKACVDDGFSSIMIDGSFLPYDENVALTRRVVEYAHTFDVSVEGELGVLAGIEEDVGSREAHYTNPNDVEDFVEKTGVDSLAISIGTSHGAYKFKLRPGEPTPTLRFDILEEVADRLPGFPIVLHGASSVPQRYIELINKYGGSIKGAVGIPEDQLRKAAMSAVCKINIDTDGRLAFTAMVRKCLSENPEEFDPRKYLGEARKELIEMIKNKNINVLGSAWKA